MAIVHAHNLPVRLFFDCKRMRLCMHLCGWVCMCICVFVFDCVAVRAGTPKCTCACSGRIVCSWLIVQNEIFSYK